MMVEVTELWGSNGELVSPRDAILQKRINAGPAGDLDLRKMS